MCLTFQMMTLEKYSIKILAHFLGGTPILAPWRAASPKMTIPALHLTPLFYCIILFYWNNVDVCEKLELNLLRFDRDIRILSLKKKHSQNFSFFMNDFYFCLENNPKGRPLDDFSQAYNFACFLFAHKTKIMQPIN